MQTCSLGWPRAESFSLERDVSFPHTEATIEQFDTGVAAVGALLRQFKTLCETQERTIEQLRADAADADTLREEVKQLQARVSEMEAHPDVRAKRIEDAQRRLDQAEAELAALADN